MASFDEVIPPGKAGTIRASIHTANFHGPVGKGISVTHDDPTQQIVLLSIKANIVGSVEVMPFPSLVLIPRSRGFSSPARLLVRKEESEKGTLKVEKLAATAPWLKVTQRAVTAEEPPAEGIPAAKPGDVEIAVVVDGAPPAGSHTETVSFATGLPREPTVSIPVSVTVRAPLTLQPADLILNPDPADAAKVIGQVLGAVREDLDPKQLVVAADNPAFTVRLEPQGERVFRAVIGWTGQGGKGPTQGQITFKVGAEEMKLPVRVNLSRVNP